MAFGQIQGPTWAKLLSKEIGVALLNGVVWGTLLGAIAYAFYGSVALGGVMALAMLLNLVLAATMGVAIPWVRARLGKDPAVGSSVLITACTDSGGFFIFLGLATLFLM
jgi:magnesium transporter